MLTAFLAQIDDPEQLRELARGFHDEVSQTHFVGAIIAIAALCGVLVAVRLLRRASPAEVERVTHLEEGAHVLGLAQAELDDLRTVAGRASVSHPAVILLSPANLARAARQAQTGKSDPALQQRMDELSIKLFGAPMGDCEPQPRERV